MTRFVRAHLASRLLRIEPLEDRRLLAASDLELLFDAHTGTQGSSPTWLTPVDGTLFFVAANTGTNTELWKTDGSLAGTTMVEEIRTSPTVGSTPLQLTSFNGALYFQADGGTGRELWRSDGTPAGTALLKEINASGSGFAGATLSIEPFAVMGSAFYFRANDGTTGPQIWRSDGTPNGTTRVSNINAPTGCDPSDLTVVGNTLYFRATDGTGFEVWKTDGTPEGTSRVKNINTTASGNADPLSLTAFGNTLYFRADDGTSGAELWKSDGSEGGTVRVKDIRTNGSSFPGQLTPVGNTLYFGAVQSASDRELWKTDGTETGTVRVKDINPGLGASTPSFLTNFNGALYFTATNGTVNELYKSNGTEAGTVPVTANHLPTLPEALKVVGGTLYFVATTPDAGVELWKSDGTSGGTAMVEDLTAGATGTALTQIVDFAGRVYLVATTSRTGTEIWREAPKSYGNYDQDRDVDGTDLLTWQRAIGSGDFATDADGNGVVNAADLGPWRTSFGVEAPAPLAPPAVTGGGSINGGSGVSVGNPFGAAPETFAATALAADKGGESTEPAPRPSVVEAHDVALSTWASPAPVAARAMVEMLGAEDGQQGDEAPADWFDFAAGAL